MMVGADAVRMVAMLALAALLVGSDVRLWHVMALLALSGAATAMFQPGLASMVPQVAEDIQRANALLRISEAICTLIGPGVAGLLVAYWNVAGSFVVIAAAYALSALGLAPLRKLGTVRDESDEPMSRRLVTGWQEFRSRSWLWGVIAVWAVYGLFVFGPSLPLGAALLTEQHGASGYGWIASADGSRHDRRRAARHAGPAPAPARRGGLRDVLLRPQPAGTRPGVVLHGHGAHRCPGRAAASPSGGSCGRPACRPTSPWPS